MADFEYNASGILVPVNASKPIMGEVASSLDGRDITRTYVDPMRVISPDDTVLMQRGGGDFTLYREILRDEKVKAGLDQRFRAVISRPFEVRPGGNMRRDKMAAQDLKEQLEALEWDKITEKMLFGVFYGFAVGETLWSREGNRVTLAGIKVRDRRRFGYDGLNRLRLKTMQDPMGELMPDRKFWHFATGADHDDAPYGLGLAHWLYWPVWLKRNGVRFWATFLEKFGTPTAVGKFPAGTSKPDQVKLLSALRAIQRDSAIIFPEGMQADLLEATRSGSADHATFTQLMNDSITILITGQTASTQGTPGKLGNSEEQTDVRRDITKADADLISMSFNAGPARWVTDWNYPGAAYPQVWRVMDEPDDLNQAAERDNKLSQVGYRPTLARVTEVYGEGYEPMQPAPAGGAPQPPVDQAQFAAPIDGVDPTPIDAMTERMQIEAAPAVKDLLDQIALFAESAESLEQLRDWLLDSYGDLDASKLQKVMQAGFAAADLSGRFDVQNDG